MRLALGAGRRRVVRQLLTEALLLTVMAEGLGIALAMWGKDLLLVLRPGTASLDLGLDTRALAVVTLLAVSTALLFGLAPALYATKGELAESLKAAQRSLPGRRGAPLRGALMVGQIAISTALLFGSVLFLSTLRNLRAVNVGFDQDRVLLFRIDPRLSQYEGEQVPALYRSLQEGYRAIPTVEAASFARHALLTGSRRTSPVSLADESDAAPRITLIGPVGPGFLEALHMPLLRGRTFTAQDDEAAPSVAVVNEAFARSMSPSRDPLGRSLRIGSRDWEIVGVAADARYYSVREPVEPTVYLPFLQGERGQAGFVLRASGDPAALASAVREVTRRIAPTVSVFEITTQRDASAATLGEERVLATMTTSFAVLALLLASIGVYGVMSHATSRRTGEIGLRLAIGARSGDILWLIARPTVGIVCLGLGVGLAMALAGSRYVERLLFGMSGTDPAAILLTVGVIVSAAAVAGYVPAARARRVSALEALRHE
jgi:predicted permease